MSNDSAGYRVLATSADNRQAAAVLAAGAHRTLAIFTRDMERVIYDTVEFVAAVRQLALRSRFSRIRIAVIDPLPAIKDGHRLIELGRRLSSFIEFRRPAAEAATLAAAFLIADESGLLYRPLAGRYEGYMDTDNPHAARIYLRAFEAIWELAEPEPEFRRLSP